METKTTRCFIHVASALTLASLIHLLSTGVAHAMVDGTPPASDDPGPEDFRFDAVAAFSQAHWLGLDPGHPNAKENSWYCNATLVDPNTVILAKHCVGNPEDELRYAVRFRRHLDGTVGTKQAGPDSYHQVRIVYFTLPAVGDVAMGHLEEAVVHIAPIPALQRGAVQLLESTPFHHAGWGKEGPGFDEGPKRELLLCDNTLVASGTYFVFPSFWANGCGVNMHDSGSPLLLEHPTTGELRTVAAVSTTTAAASLARYLGDPNMDIPTAPFPGVDLYIADVVVPEDMLAPEQLFVWSVTLGNAGDMPVYGTDLVAWLSFDEVHGNEDDIPLLTTVLDQTFGPESETVIELSVNLPQALQAGVVRLGMKVDGSNAVDETFETNNSFATDRVIAVSPEVVQMNGLYFGILDDPGGQQQYSMGYAIYERINATAVFLGYHYFDKLGLIRTHADATDGLIDFLEEDGGVTMDLRDESMGYLTGTATFDTVQYEMMGAGAIDTGYAGYAAGYYTGEGALHTAHAIVLPTGNAFLTIAGDPLHDAAQTLLQLVPGVMETADSANGHAVEFTIQWNTDSRRFELTGTWTEVPSGTVHQLLLTREGTPCDTDVDCNQGYVCLGSGFEATCQPACEDDDDCAAGLVCETESGLCIDPVDPPCSSHSSCGDGFVCDKESGACIELKDDAIEDASEVTSGAACDDESGACDDGTITEASFPEIVVASPSLGCSALQPQMAWVSWFGSVILVMIRRRRASGARNA